MEQNYLRAIKAALEAGQEILKVYNSNDFEVEIKNDNSPLTKADKASHLKIMEYLEQTSIPVLSEEGRDIPYEERKNWNQLWIVDPLDGTKEFIKRNGEFTVNIALVEAGNPILGVIYIPVEQTLYVGIKGIGAYKIEDIESIKESNLNLENFLQIGSKLPIKSTRPYTVVASRSHLSEETEAYIKELKQQHPDLTFFSRGSSLKLCAVAEGAADIYPRFAPTMEWDTAAGQAIVEAAGGKVILRDGTPMVYNRENLLNPYFIVSLA